MTWKDFPKTEENFRAYSVLVVADIGVARLKKLNDRVDYCQATTDGTPWIVEVMLGRDRFCNKGIGPWKTLREAKKDTEAEVKKIVLLLAAEVERT